MTLAKLLNFLELWFPHLGRIIGPASKGKIEGKRRRVQKRLKWLNSIADSTDMNLSKLQEIVKDRGLPDIAGESTLLSRSRGEKELK